MITKIICLLKILQVAALASPGSNSVKNILLKWKCYIKPTFLSFTSCHVVPFLKTYLECCLKKKKNQQKVEFSKSNPLINPQSN